MRVKILLKGGWKKGRSEVETGPIIQSVLERVPQSYWDAVSALGSHGEESLCLNQSMIFILIERFTS